MFVKFITFPMKDLVRRCSEKTWSNIIEMALHWPGIIVLTSTGAMIAFYFMPHISLYSFGSTLKRLASVNVNMYVYQRWGSVRKLDSKIVVIYTGKTRFPKALFTESVMSLVLSPNMDWLTFIYIMVHMFGMFHPLACGTLQKGTVYHLWNAKIISNVHTVLTGCIALPKRIL